MTDRDHENRDGLDTLVSTTLEHLGLQTNISLLVNTSDTAMKLLQSSVWTERIWAVRTCGQFKQESAVLEALLAMLNDPMWQVRATTLLVLADQRTSVSQEVFLAALGDKEEAVRALAVRILSLFGKDMPVASITAIANDPSWIVREAAILALGELRGQAPVSPLVTALTDEDPAVQEAALLILQQHYPPAARTMVSRAGNVIEQEDTHQASWATIASEPVAERQSPSVEIDVYSSRVPLLNRAFSKRKRWLWYLLESAVATLLLIGSFFSWLALTRYLSPVPADVHLVQTPTEQTMFPPIQPGKILLTYHGDKRVSTSQWTADSRYLGVSNDSALTPNQYVNGGEYIQIWNAATGTLTKRWTLPSLPPHAQGLFSFEADRYLLLLSNQGLLQIWDYVSGQKLLDITSPGAHGWPDWRWSKDQRWLAISSPKNHQVEIWDAIHRKQIASYSALIAPDVAWQWSPDDRYLAGLTGNGELVVWNAFTGNVVLNVHRDNGASLFWSPDNQKLVVTQPTKDQMQFWNVVSRKQVFTFSGVAQSVQWTNNGERMLADERTSLVVWDTQTGQVMATLPLSAKAWATVSPDGLSIAYAPGDNTLQIWDAIRGRMVARYDGFVGKGQLLTASWSPDSRVLAALGGNGVLLLWKASTGTAVAAYSVPLFPMPGLIWSPNAKYIVLTSQQPIFAIVEPGK